MKKIALLSLSLALLVSCSMKDSAPAYSEALAPSMKADAERSAPAEAGGPGDKAAPKYAVADRKIIREGSVSFRTGDIAKSKAEIDGIVARTGSYYGSDNQASMPGRLEGTCTVRIPTEKFDLFIELLTRAAGELESKRIDALDVTEEYMDLEARIRNKKELELTFRELLPKGKTVEEILSIERQIAEVREEIERSEGRLRFLEKRVSYSTLTITYYQELPSAGFRYLENLRKAFHGGWRFLQGLTIGLVYLWPLWVICLLLYSCARFYLARRGKRC